MMIALISGAALLGVAGTALLLRAKTRQEDRPSPPDTGLPSISYEEGRAVIEGAERDAIRAALGASTAPTNPHPPGTRAHILWETHFHSILMDWDDGSPNEPPTR